MAGEPMIEFREVVKSFRTRNRSDSLRDAVSRGLGRLVGRRRPAVERHTALRGVSFSVMPGEVLGIVGANGAGKSTSLRLSAGVYPPNGGEVLVRGRVAALIELSAGFHPDLSGRENIHLEGALLGLTRQEVADRFDLIAEFADIGEYLESPARTYSTGMAVRLGFAVAAHVPAEVLLVDEVLAVGDMEFRTKCMRKMAERRDEGATVLFVSHQLAQVEQFCDRVIFLHEGKVAADGPPRETLDRYREQVATDTRVQDVRESVTPQRRRGTGEVLLEDVGLSGDGEGSGGVVAVGGTLKVTGRWRVRKQAEEIVLGVEVSTLEGIVVGSVTEPLPGGTSPPPEGRFELELPGLTLVPGRYEMTVFAVDPSGLVIFDMHQCLYPFEVTGEKQGDGIVRLPARWKLEEAD